MLTAETGGICIPWAEDQSQVLEKLHAVKETGLTSPEAARRLEIAGPNSIESIKRRGLLRILLNQFVSPFVLLLAIAAGLSFFFEEWLDGIAIVAVILINAVIGFFMEFQAERSMETLKKLTMVPVRALRDNRLTAIPSEQVVPGDIIFVEAGDMIAADARLFQAAQLQTDESALTGESLPVGKTTVALPRDIPLAERSNMLYKGTFVSKGNGYAVVVCTGMKTELGAIARLVQQAGQVATPLEKKLQVFSRKLIWVTVALAVSIFIAGLVNGQKLVEMLETSIALVVAAVPEGLPIVATLALAFGMLRMARHNIIVKKLSSVETLGGTNVICTDKTGTLTQNKITASFIQIGNSSSAIDLDPGSSSVRWLGDSSIADTPACRHIYRIAALCNTASYQHDSVPEKESGDPLEVGLLKLVYCAGITQETYNTQFPKVDEIPFSSDTKVMATLHRNGQEFYIAAKGAVEALLFRCTTVLEADTIIPLTEERKKQWLMSAEKQAQSGLRVLAFAFRVSKEKETDFLHRLTLAGLIGFIDPPRPEVPAAIEECKSAGIKVVMITGDHPATARNIAMQLGLANESDAVIHGSAMKPFDQLTNEDKELWLHAPVFARVSPEHKLNLVKLFQERKMIVGMTGDGVNDAPALKKADIGIAMGQRGTQVAQDVADMVLKDDAFSSIVVAIKQGRVIFDNIRKFVIFLLSCNLSELLLIAAASILNLHFRLFPLQILFINLVTDVLPALALGLTEAAPHIMQRRPYSSGTPVIDRKRWSAIFTYSVVIAGSSIGAVFVSHVLLHNQEKFNFELCNNILFYTLILSQILHVFNMSFERGLPFYRTAVFRNKYVWYAVGSCILITTLSYWVVPMRKVLQVSIYSWEDWSVVVFFPILSLVIIQVLKKIRWVI
ncbi:cation-transporting P-type ATPase [Chitinophaga oryzae]|uniref:Cation-transporting P-type ATPase n=1 Tax=Chitinophaga oryzae TaxID=2725414 RepID=A0ABX6LAX9_9BACT|nr:cation-transporting P-type ATPase [Chitinophaga oryzae]QJB37251.1 cation-transporting P-type ATPase [Chitinophaga oryzae]